MSVASVTPAVTPQITPMQTTVDEQGDVKVVARFMAKLHGKKHTADLQPLVKTLSQARPSKPGHPSICEINGVHCSAQGVESMEVSLTSAAAIR